MPSSLRPNLFVFGRYISVLTLLLTFALLCTPSLADESFDSSEVTVPSISYRSHLSNVGWGSSVEGVFL